MHALPSKKISTLSALLKKNTLIAKKYKTNSTLMHLIHSKKMEQKKYRKKLLDAVQVFSDYFQKVVLLRNALCEHSIVAKVTQEHLQEEFCHNLLLMKDRDYRAPIWDPILEATAAWFCWKMFTLDNEEKTLIVHLVLETSANIFFRAAHKVMEKYQETSYFEIHSVADEKHEAMGKFLLEGLSKQKYQRLSELLLQSWDVLNAACNRIAELTLN